MDRVEDVESLNELPFAEDRLYIFAEIVLMLDGWGRLPEEVGERNEDAVRGWVEHMDAGECPVGRASDGPTPEMVVSAVARAIEKEYSPVAAPVEVRQVLDRLRS